MTGDYEIAARWEELGQMDRAALRVAWAEAFGGAPPHFLSMIFMRKALIWDAQCRAFGGLTTDVKRALKSAACGKQLRNPTHVIKTGTQLVREWNGRRPGPAGVRNGPTAGLPGHWRPIRRSC